MKYNPILHTKFQNIEFNRTARKIVPLNLVIYDIRESQSGREQIHYILHISERNKQLTQYVCTAYMYSC